MDHTPHIRRSAYLDKELKRAKIGINCYGFACKRVGVADTMSGVLFFLVKNKDIEEFEDQVQHEQKSPWKF